jgi:hypothetical protein
VVLELLKQPVDIVAIHTPGLAEARDQAVGEVRAVTWTLQKQA